MSECTNCKQTVSVPDGGDVTCPAVGYQSMSVCVPVTVTPYAKPLGTSTTCCGDPVVTGGDKPCAGKKGGSCTFTITQKICVAVPVEFGATALPGDTYVDCLEASGEDICKDCDEPEA